MLKTVLALGLTAALALTAATTPAAAVDNAAGTYKMDRSHSSLVWRVSHIGLSFYTARFNTFDATLEIDPENPTGAKLAVTVDPTSLKTGYPFAAKKDFDKKLITDARFFNANEHPEIKFVSTGLEMTGDKTAKVTGDLTLLGVT
ncbi:MAG: YceI family protein, partial [Pseudomonadota bacterium]